MTKRWWNGALATLVLVAACGDDDGPKDECDALVAEACAKIDGCGVLDDVAQCRRDQSRVLRCDEATAVGAGVRQCVEDIQGRACAEWSTALNDDFVLPGSCQSAVTYD